MIPVNFIFFLKCIIYYQKQHLIFVILPQCKDIHPSLEDIAADVMENCTNDQIDSFNSKMSFSDSQIHELEKATRNQSNSNN